jgi:hypothetical protein
LKKKKKPARVTDNLRENFLGLGRRGREEETLFTITKE